jgi:hypothetical protein
MAKKKENFRKLLRVEPGSKVDLAGLDCGETFGRAKERAEEELTRCLPA